MRQRVTPDREEVTETLEHVPSLQGDPTYPREAVVPDLRHRHGRTGTRSRDGPQPRRCGAPRPHRHMQVRRLPAALPPGRDLRPRERQARAGRRRRAVERSPTRAHVAERGALRPARPPWTRVLLAVRPFETFPGSATTDAAPLPVGVPALTQPRPPGVA